VIFEKRIIGKVNSLPLLNALFSGVGAGRGMNLL